MPPKREPSHSTDLVVPAIPDELRRMYALSGIETLTEAAAQARGVQELRSRLEGDLNNKIKSGLDARPTFQTILRAIYANRGADEVTDDEPPRPTIKPKRPPLRPSVDDKYFLRITHPEGHGDDDAVDRKSYLEALAEGNRPLASSVLVQTTGAYLLGMADSAEPPSTARLELELYKMYASLGDVDGRFMTASAVTSWHSIMQGYVPTFVRAHEARLVVDKIFKKFLGTDEDGQVIVSPEVHQAIDRLQDVRHRLSTKMSKPGAYQPCGESDLERFDEAMERLTEFELPIMVEERYHRGWNDLDAVRVADRLTAMLETVHPRLPESKDIFAARSLGNRAVRNMFGGA